MEAVPSNYEERMSWIESIVARAEDANELAHENFRAEDTMILRSQMELNSGMQKLNIAMQGMSDAIEQLAKETAKTERVLRRDMRETTGKLNALIAVVDNMISPKGPQA
jgi:hypothetical protein